MSDVDVSVILPTMNEEMAISVILPKIIRVMKGLGLTYEIIVVDKSDDNTPQIAERLGAKVIRQRGRGYGDAYLLGFASSRGKYILMLDPDGSYDPEDIPKLLEPLLRGDADFVLGSRLRGNIDDGAMPWLHRYIGNPFLTWVLNLLFKTKVSDAHCGMRAIRRDSLQKLSLKCKGMEFASEMIIEAAKRGLKIVEVPINYHRRIGHSKLSSFRDGWRHLRLMLLYSPSYLFFVPSIILIGVGLLTVLYTYFISPQRVHTLILGSMMILSGFQIMGFGISAKVYAVKEGFDSPSWLTNFFMRYSILEEGVVLGSILLVVGVVLGAYIFIRWRATGYRALFMIKDAVLVLTLITLGVQIVFFSFFISIYLLKEGQ